QRAARQRVGLGGGEAAVVQHDLVHLAVVDVGVIRHGAVVRAADVGAVAACAAVGGTAGERDRADVRHRDLRAIHVEARGGAVVAGGDVNPLRAVAGRARGCHDAG